ncbi:MAG: SRPBCC family protein [Methanosarcina sp.]
MTESNQKTGDQELVITRVFDAPRNLVWKVWTEPEHVMEWWGPKGFTAPVIKTDFRVGGKSLLCMRSPEGEDYWSTGVYREIVEQEKIVTTDSFSDAQGNVVPASHYGMSGDWPLELLVTATFEEDKGKTKLTLRHEGFPDRENRDLAKAGWNESLDKFAEYLTKS